MLIVVLLAGCTFKGSMRPTINATLSVPKPYTVQAIGYPAPNRDIADGSYYSLSVNLVAAAPFAFKFPDGFTANSRHLDVSTLSNHLAPVEKTDRGSLVSRRTVFNGSARYSVVFSVGPEGTATGMWLYACKAPQARLLGTADENQWFSFPIKHSELQTLFGGPLRVGHDFTILGTECD